MKKQVDAILFNTIYEVVYKLHYTFDDDVLYDLWIQIGDDEIFYRLYDDSEYMKLRIHGIGIVIKDATVINEIFDAIELFIHDSYLIIKK